MDKQETVPAQTGETNEAQVTETAPEVKPEAVTDTDALKKQIANLEKVLGRQGKELGDLKKQKAQPEQPPKDYDALEAGITERLDAGEIDLKTALREMNKLASERGAMQAAALISEQQKQERSSQMVSAFKQSNPDFDDLYESGALDQIMKENPLHDEFSAYHEYKRKELQSQMEQQLLKAKEEGKNEGIKIAAETGKASKVLGKAGDNVRDQQPAKPYATRMETRAAMEEALRKARG